VLPTGQKPTLGLLAPIIIEVLTFHAYAPFLELLPFLKCILEVVFCEGLQHFPRFCLHHLNCAKMAVVQFIFIRGNKKVRWVGGDSHLLLVKNSLVKKEV
jgi:hypothetical protein